MDTITEFYEIITVYFDTCSFILIPSEIPETHPGRRLFIYFGLQSIDPLLVVLYEAGIRTNTNGGDGVLFDCVTWEQPL